MEIRTTVTFDISEGHDPDADEICDGEDNNCDGDTDEGCTTDEGDPGSDMGADTSTDTGADTGGGSGSIEEDEGCGCGISATKQGNGLIRLLLLTSLFSIAVLVTRRRV